MFTTVELLSKRNQKMAFEHMAKKRDGCGSDGMRISELESYWKVNSNRICREIVQGRYEPGVIVYHQIINSKGKTRYVSSLNAIDRFITRLLAQKMKRYFEPEFLNNSYAYQDGKGVLGAVNKAKEYIDTGCKHIAEIDIKDYFDNVDLDELIGVLNEKVSDESLMTLFRGYLYCNISQDGKITPKCKGLVQGSAISPILSNMYLHPLDCYMKERGYKWIRFADNIYIYTESHQGAIDGYNDVVDKLQQDFKLKVNVKKSGIFSAYNRRILGYDFELIKGQLDVRKHQYKEETRYNNWNRCLLKKVDKEYHIVRDGVIDKKDYALLFENEECKHYIPVEVVKQINIHSDVILSANVLRTLNEKNIKASFFDKHGRLVGNFVPDRYTQDANILLGQCKIYNGEKRLEIAKKMECANIHNLRAMLKYYNKTKNLDEYVDDLTEYMKQLAEENCVDRLMLIEARARQRYYQAFNVILQDRDFTFDSRTKQPPRNPINAMISFGNTLLYNEFLQHIWMKGLDPRIGVIHATNRRAYTLNLDFADVFKPIVVDRVIFTLINHRQITAREHFRNLENGGVYLSDEGKRVFLKEFNRKLNTKLVVKGTEYTYRQLMQQEVQNFLGFVECGEKYKPYKYY